MSSTKVKEPSTLELAEQFAEDIKRAQLASAKVTAAIVAADAEIAAAGTARGDAMDALVLECPHAEEDHRAATVRLVAAHEQRAGLDEQQESAMRVLRGSQERLRALRVHYLGDFAAEAEKVVSECAKAAEALAGPLRSYRAAWERAERIWRPLARAVRAKTESDDAARGQYRSGEGLDRDLRVPDCPIGGELLKRVGEVLPRPEAMSANYVGDPFQPVEAAAEGDLMPEFVGPDGPLLFDTPS